MSNRPWIDRALLAVAPGVAAKRIAARRSYEVNDAAMLELRKYEAAKTGRRNDGWARPGSSANAEIVSSFGGLSAGARQLIRDNGHAANALNVIANNTIGTGIRAGFTSESDAHERMLEELWESHVEGQSSGVGEIGGVYDRQLVAFRSIVESGSALLRYRLRDQRGLNLPYKIEVMEPDFLATNMDGLSAARGHSVISGKEFNAENELVRFHIYKQHPGDAQISLRGFGDITTVTPWYMSHAFRMDRPGQSQGASWFAPIATTLRDLSDTRDAYQLRQKIAACYTVFLYDSEPQVGVSSNNAVTDHIEPGRVETIPAGKQVAFASPPGVEGMADFDKAQLMTISAGLGIPYEALTGDLSEVNFLSGRMGWLAFYRNIDSWRTSVVIPKICEREMDWFLESVAVARGERVPTRVNWVSPHRDLLDPSKEIKAMREEARLGLLSYPDMVRMRGRDPKKVIDSWARWAKEVDDRDLTFDWDPRKFSLAGNNIEEQVTQALEEGNDA